jgi:hypothetical protein
MTHRAEQNAYLWLSVKASEKPAANTRSRKEITGVILHALCLVRPAVVEAVTGTGRKQRQSGWAESQPPCLLGMPVT